MCLLCIWCFQEVSVLSLETISSPGDPDKSQLRTTSDCNSDGQIGSVPVFPASAVLTGSESSSKSANPIHTSHDGPERTLEIVCFSWRPHQLPQYLNIWAMGGSKMIPTGARFTETGQTFPENFHEGNDHRSPLKNMTRNRQYPTPASSPSRQFEGFSASPTFPTRLQCFASCNI